MQAYASAQLSPLKSEYPVASIPPAQTTTPVVANGDSVVRTDRLASAPSMLASLMLDGLDDRGLAVLARRLLPHLKQPAEPGATRASVAYTVASLAAELGVSQKTIRCAIARRELAAVKRGSRWIISADAVQAWASAPEVQRRPGHICRTRAPKASGPSLRSVLCGGASRGDTR